MGVRVTALSEDWNPLGSTFDPDRLSQPGAMSNLKNGFGFWGSTATGEIDWIPSDKLARALGYVTR
jgi:hypothetical protein